MQSLARDKFLLFFLCCALRHFPIGQKYPYGGSFTRLPSIERRPLLYVCPGGQLVGVAGSDAELEYLDENGTDEAVSGGQ